MTAPSSFYSGAYAPISSFNATSSDLVTIAAGPQTFNIQSGKTFLAGMGLQILSLSTNNLMAGSVTSYSGTVLVVNVTSTIGSGTFSDWQITLAGSPGAQGATGSTGAAGSNGSNGTNGTGFTTTSATSLVTAGAGSKVFTTTQAANTLAWTAGARLRATSAGTGEWMEGLVTAYSGTTLTVTMDSNSGTGTHADWNINPAGQAGANGSGVAGQTAHNVCIAATATSLAAGVALGANQILVGAAGSDPAAATVSGDLTNVAGAFTIANSAVTYAKIQNVAAGAILGRVTGAGAGVMTELTPGQVVTNIGGTVLALFQASTWKTFYTDGSSVLQSLSVGAAGTVPTSAGTAAAPTFKYPAADVPGGRLTLTTATPVMATTASAQTTVYYTPYLHRFVPLYDGTGYVMTDTGGELSQTTTDSSKSPAAVTANSNYDLFVWSDSGTIRCTRGPAWTSSTARGSGAGTTELGRVSGILLNANAITNGPAANRGTYVGTLRSNAGSTIDYIFGAQGTAAFFGVWNTYNRVTTSTFVSDGTGSWTYLSATIRQSNNSATNRISFVTGLAEDGIMASFNQRIIAPSAAGEYGYAGLALDSTTAFDLRAIVYSTSATGLIGNSVSTISYGPQLGFHFIQSLEQGDGTSNATFSGATDMKLAAIFQT